MVSNTFQQICMEWLYVAIAPLWGVGDRDEGDAQAARRAIGSVHASLGNAARGCWRGCNGSAAAWGGGERGGVCVVAAGACVHLLRNSAENPKARQLHVCAFCAVTWGQRTARRWKGKKRN